MPTHSTFEPSIDYGRIFQPDALAEAQYLAAHRRTYHGQPELRLMWAILEDAVATLMTDVRRCTSRQRRDFTDAMTWIQARTDQRSIFSFINICETLAIDPDYLRQGLLRKGFENRDRSSLAGAGFKKYISPRLKAVRLRAV